MRAAAADRNEDAAAREAAAARADREFEDALTTLAAEIAELRRRFAGVIDQMGRVGEASGHSLRAAVQAASTEGLGVGDRVTAEVGGELKGLREDRVRAAREHPWRTVGLAAVAGVVVGLAARR
jgi:ElaB/YqjD/DUF883 family membrane-anchored ribosome-binding protein